MHESGGTTFDEAIDFPWWASIVLAALVYVVLKFVLPGIFTATVLSVKVAGVLQEFAVPFAAIFLVPAAIAVMRAHRRGSVQHE